MNLKDFFLVNKEILNKWLGEHLESAKEKTITLDDREIAERTNAIIEARVYKKLLNEISVISRGEKSETKTDNI